MKRYCEFETIPSPPSPSTWPRRDEEILVWWFKFSVRKQTFKKAIGFTTKFHDSGVATIKLWNI